LAADRYHDRPKVASDALYRAGLAHKKQAQTADYDQSAAGQAIATFTDFKTLYPDDSRVAQTDRIIADLKGEQARAIFKSRNSMRNARNGMARSSIITRFKCKIRTHLTLRKRNSGFTH